MQQQRLAQLQQQQAVRQALAAQQYTPGMPMAMPMNQLTPQQYAAMRSRMPMGMAPHLAQAQLAQQQHQGQPLNVSSLWRNVAGICC